MKQKLRVVIELELDIHQKMTSNNLNDEVDYMLGQMPYNFDYKSDEMDIVKTKIIKHDVF